VQAKLEELECIGVTILVVTLCICRKPPLRETGQRALGTPLYYKSTMTSITISVKKKTNPTLSKRRRRRRKEKEEEEKKRKPS
jgi:hypothetical protein